MHEKTANVCAEKLPAFFRASPALCGSRSHPRNCTLNHKGTFDLVEIYNPITRTWRAGTRLPVGLHGLYPVVWNGSIYSGGGSSAYDRGTSTTLLVYAPAP